MTKHVILALILLIATTSVCHAQFRPEKFGVIVGSNQSPAVRAANHSAMKAALDEAMRSGGSVLLPAATIEIDVPNQGSSASSTLKINRSIQIIGTDRNLSKIKFGPESPSYDYSGFYVGPGTFVSFRNCTLEGPSDPGPNGKLNRLTYAILQSGMTYGPGKVQVYNTPGELRLEQVTIAGEWFTSIQGAHGDVALVLIDSDITGYTQCVAWSATFNLGKRLYAKNTYFHDAGLPGKGHLIYLSPVVSFEIDGCRFAGNYRFAIHHYGSGQSAPKFAKLLNSRFESSCADGIETTNTGVTEIRNCIFENKRRAVALKGDTTIENCTFRGPIVTTYDRHSGVRINIKHSKFFGGGVITSVWPDCVWNISDCDFIGQGPGNIAIANGAPGTQIRVDNCRFSGHFRRGIVAASGSYFVSNSSFDGTYGEAAIIYDDTSGSVEKVRVDNSSFATNGRSIWAKNGASGKVSGIGNHFGASQPVAKPGMYQELELRAAAFPTELSSRTQLVTNFDYNSYRVTGETRIERIDLGGSEATTQMCAGKLQLVAAGRWSLGDGGNIKPLTTAPRQRGQTITLVRDVQAGLWVEVAN
jgi:hypothetical protein